MNNIKFNCNKEDIVKALDRVSLLLRYSEKKFKYLILEISNDALTIKTKTFKIGCNAQIEVKVPIQRLDTEQSNHYTLLINEDNIVSSIVIIKSEGFIRCIREIPDNTVIMELGNVFSVKHINNDNIITKADEKLTISNTTGTTKYELNLSSYINFYDYYDNDLMLIEHKEDEDKSSYKYDTTIKVNADTLMYMFLNTKNSTAENSEKTQGILLKLKDKAISAISTNAAMISIMEHKIDLDFDYEIRERIPIEFVRLVAKLLLNTPLKEIEMCFKEKYIVLDLLDDCKVAIELIKGKPYIDYEPKVDYINEREKIKSELVINTKDLMQKINSMLNELKYIPKNKIADSYVELIVEDDKLGLKLNAKSSSGIVYIQTKYNKGSNLRIKLNPRYIYDSLMCLKEKEVKLTFKGNKNYDECIIEPINKDYIKHQYIILPIVL